MNISELHKIFLASSGVVTDTRKIEPNQVFFALKGDNFNGNTFANQALLCGALRVVIDQEDYYIDDRTILVDDVLTTLQDLAKYHRSYLGLPIIALTGSNGKTTTKELINVVLSKKYKTKATVGNFNNHIGVPLTLLSFNSDTEIGIVEMGANHQKEIEFLCSIAQPNYGYITNFGKAHLEGFGGVQGVIAGKSEMYEYFEKVDSSLNTTLFVNADDQIQVEKTKNLKVFSFSSQNNDSDVFISNIVANPLVNLVVDGIKIQSNLIGIYNAANISLSIAVGKYFGVPIEDVCSAISDYFPNNNRSQLIELNSNHIILDAYNANPTSMKAAIDNFNQLQSVNKIMFLGDMFELGESSSEEHKFLIEYVSSLNFTKVIFVGKFFFEHRFKSDWISFYNSFDNLKDNFSKYKILESNILIKGSRGMALERILDLL